MTLRLAARRIRAYLVSAEFWVAALGLAGWALVTWGLAWGLRAWWVLPLSAGLLLLGLHGYQLLGRVIWRGLYQLRIDAQNRDKDETSS